MSRLAHLDFVPSRNQLPWPPLVVGEMQKSRLREHYERTLAADMMYMMYEPTGPSSSSKDSPRNGTTDRSRRWSNDSPYHANRPARAQLGNRPLVPLHKPLSMSRHIEHDIPRIERIIFRPLLFRVTLCVSYLSKGKFIFILHMIKVKLISLTAQLGKLQSNHP